MNSSENWHLEIDPSVYKTLARIPKKDAARISVAIEQLAVNPYAGDTHKIGGEDVVWRRRIGSYRIFYELHVGMHYVVVFHLERRGSNTY